MKESIVIFGASTAGRTCYEFLKNRFQIKYFCDNNESIIGQYINGTEIISPDYLQQIATQYDRIIIASSYYEEIREQLSIMKIDKPIQKMIIELKNEETLLNYSEDYDDLTNFINGNRLHSGLKIKYDGIGRYQTRDDVIKEIIRKCKVIDLGCTDHLSLIDYKLSNNIWLHSIVKSVSSKCIGIDINKDAVDYVNKLGYKDVIYADIIKDEIDEIIAERWDYLLMAEILEHVNNPVYFLKKIKEKYKNNIYRYILTIPNALSKPNMELAKKNIELINTDHRYWFTPYTIMKVLYEADFKVKELIMCGLKEQEYMQDESLMMPNIIVIAE